MEFALKMKLSCIKYFLLIFGFQYVYVVSKSTALQTLWTSNTSLNKIYNLGRTF